MTTRHREVPMHTLVPACCEPANRHKPQRDPFILGGVPCNLVLLKFPALDNHGTHLSSIRDIPSRCRRPLSFILLKGWNVLWSRRVQTWGSRLGIPASSRHLRSRDSREPWWLWKHEGLGFGCCLPGRRGPPSSESRRVSESIRIPQT